MSLDPISQYSIYKSVQLQEPYYCVKVIHRNTKEEKFIFLNHSFPCSRALGMNMLGYFASTFKGDKRGVAPLGTGWIIKTVKKVK